jgi:Protein of unknown function (DUF1566)
MSAVNKLGSGASSPPAAAGSRWLLLVLLLGAVACRQGTPGTTGVAPSAVDAATVKAIGDSPRTAESTSAGPPRPHAPAEAWASWPMPNARLPGLPNPHSYDMRIDGVVVDLVTGLMWQRIAPNKFLIFKDAERECDGLKLAGHDDWRLPSRIELVSILDTTRTQPSIDFEAFPGTASDWFWTSSLAADNPHSAWYVYFYFGYPKTDDMTNQFSVRCVRPTRPKVALPARYDVQAQAVRDVVTGLVWQRTAPGKTFQFAEARAYCERLRLGGKKHWRLPSLPELLTLIDEHAAAPMIDRSAFPNTPGEPFWSSSTFANGTELAWYVRFDQGSGLYGRLIEPFRVRCVL